MSLRAIHIFVILTSILLAVFYGAWSLNDYFNSKNNLSLYLGVLSFLVAGILVPYILWFLKKIRGESSK